MNREQSAGVVGKVYTTATGTEYCQGCEDFSHIYFPEDITRRVGWYQETPTERVEVRMVQTSHTACGWQVMK